MKQLSRLTIITYCLTIVVGCDDRPHRTIVDQRPKIIFSELTSECQEFISEKLNLNNGVAAAVSFYYKIKEDSVEMYVSLYERIDITTRGSFSAINNLLFFTVNQSRKDITDNSTTRVNNIEISIYDYLHEGFDRGIELVGQRVDEELISPLSIVPNSIWLKFKLNATRGTCADEDIFIEIDGTKI